MFDSWWSCCLDGPKKMWESAYVKTNVKLMGRHEKVHEGELWHYVKANDPACSDSSMFYFPLCKWFFFLPPTHACWCFLHPVDSKVTSTWKWNAPYYLFMNMKKNKCGFVLTGCSGASSKTARFAEPVILGIYIYVFFFLSHPEQILIRSFKLQPESLAAVSSSNVCDDCKGR